MGVVCAMAGSAMGPAMQSRETTWASCLTFTGISWAGLLVRSFVSVRSQSVGPAAHLRRAEFVRTLTIPLYYQSNSMACLLPKTTGPSAGLSGARCDFIRCTFICISACIALPGTVLGQALLSDRVTSMLAQAGIRVVRWAQCTFGAKRGRTGRLQCACAAATGVHHQDAHCHRGLETLGPAHRARTELRGPKARCARGGGRQPVVDRPGQRGFQCRGTQPACWRSFVCRVRNPFARRRGDRSRVVSTFRAD